MIIENIDLKICFRNALLMSRSASYKNNYTAYIIVQ